MRFDSIDGIVRDLGWRLSHINEISLREFIIEACRDFCYRTHVSSEDVTSFVGQGISEAEFSTPPQTEAITIHAMSTSSGAIDPATVEELNARFPTWRTMSGTPRRFVMVSEKIAQVTPVPTATMEVSAKVITRPIVGATRVDARLANDWRAAIKAKVLAEYHIDMMERSRQDAMYETAVSRCLAAVRAGNAGADARVTGPRFAK